MSNTPTNLGIGTKNLWKRPRTTSTGRLVCWKSAVHNCLFPTHRALPVRSTGTCGNCAYKAAAIRSFRIFYAFDPRRSAILLIGGDKTGDARFYEKMIPVADRLYDEYLGELRKEGLLR